MAKDNLRDDAARMFVQALAITVHHFEDVSAEDRTRARFMNNFDKTLAVLLSTAENLRQDSLDDVEYLRVALGDSLKQM